MAMTNQSLEITTGPMAYKGPVEIKEVPMKSIRLGKNSRLSVSDEEISGLMQSIQEVGLLQPIGLIAGEDGEYEVCYGNRRFLAVQKLGKHKIAAVIHSNKTSAEADMQNLTENLQRKNISLTEAGRYFDILKKAGLSEAEMAVRMGLSKSYVRNCIGASQGVPKEFREDVDLRTHNDRVRAPGRISIAAVKAINSAVKTYKLNESQARYLYKAAKSRDEFKAPNVKKYASAILAGEKDPIMQGEDYTIFHSKLIMTKKERARLVRKYVTNGPFKNLSELFVSILSGRTREKCNLN